jgi:hypothetical protein
MISDFDQSEEDIVQLLQQGRGAMRPYGAFVSPKGTAMPATLSIEEMRDTAAFVLKQASEGSW